ncbi:hypothetical protein CKO36_16355 [Rhabdochromatium marinum]|nr:hypothetical protein [Rhabdochromatium marinum]
MIALVALLLWMLSLARFSDVETAWETHNTRATSIGNALSELQRHIGYGGFIHNFKNLVLRQDLPRYQARIDEDIAGFRKQIDRLDHLLWVTEDKQALEQIRLVFEEYVDKYAKIPSMVTAGASAAELDAVVKVDDTPAIQAFIHLSKRAEQRARETERQATSEHDSAVRFALIGGILVLSAMFSAAIILLRFLRQLVAANDAIHQAEARLNTLLDTAPDVMVTAARDGRIVRANQMAERFFGYRHDELLAMTVEQLIPERFRSEHIKHRNCFFNNAQHRPMDVGKVLTGRTRDGREISVQASLSYSAKGEEILATITLRDVTEQERNQQILLEAKQQAESALTLQRQLQKELVQTEKLAALGSLVAGVAHEINTPVGVTLSAATYLESETHKIDQAYQAGELSEEELNDYFATARQATRLMSLNSERAANLIHSFKQIAVDRTGGERRTFDLAIYIDEVLLSLHPRLKKTPIEIQVDCPAGLILDSLPGAFSQVLTNLIINASVHAFEPDQAGHIAITARTTTDKQVKILFSDDGKGIPPELHKRVFEPFFTTQRSQGGSGLGLHIMYTLVTQSLKGTLTFSSTPNQGTTFAMCVPLVLPTSSPKD